MRHEDNQAFKKLLQRQAYQTTQSMTCPWELIFFKKKKNDVMEDWMKYFCNTYLQIWLNMKSGNYLHTCYLIVLSYLIPKQTWIEKKAENYKYFN